MTKTTHQRDSGELWVTLPIANRSPEVLTFLLAGRSSDFENGKAPVGPQ